MRISIPRDPHGVHRGWYWYWDDFNPRVPYRDRQTLSDDFTYLYCFQSAGPLRSQTENQHTPIQGTAISNILFPSYQSSCLPFSAFLLVLPGCVPLIAAFPAFSAIHRSHSKFDRRTIAECSVSVNLLHSRALRSTATEKTVYLPRALVALMSMTELINALSPFLQTKHFIHLIVPCICGDSSQAKIK